VAEPRKAEGRRRAYSAAIDEVSVEQIDVAIRRQSVQFKDSIQIIQLTCKSTIK
jgi:hypothetical protein